MYKAHGEHHPQTGTPGLPNAYFLHLFTDLFYRFSHFSPSKIRRKIIPIIIYHTSKSVVARCHRSSVFFSLFPRCTINRLWPTTLGSQTLEHKRHGPTRADTKAPRCWSRLATGPNLATRPSHLTRFAGSERRLSHPASGPSCRAWTHLMHSFTTTWTTREISQVTALSYKMLQVKTSKDNLSEENTLLRKPPDLLGEWPILTPFGPLCSVHQVDPSSWWDACPLAFQQSL